VDELGKRLKALRAERELTLAQLGRQVGLSSSYLSQIERGVSMPSLGTLTTIASVLAVDVGHFFEDEVSSHWIVRAGDTRRLEGLGDSLVELLSGEAGERRFQPYRLVCQPGALGDERPVHSGEEFGFVLRGQLTVTVGEETFVLEAGDSIHCETLQSRSWRNDGDEECVVICAVSPPISESELGG
jgi:transcriptional regulator with XRE-family HTH domain